MLMAERFAAYVASVMAGDGALFRRVIEASGGTWRDGPDGLVVTRADGFVAGILRSDPVSCAAGVGFALCGPLWALVPEIRDGYELVSRRASAAVKAAREAKHGFA